MSDDTEKTKLPVSEETQAMLGQVKPKTEELDSSQPGQPPSGDVPADGEKEIDLINTHKLANSPAKDDTLIPRPTTVKISDMPEIERTVRYGEAVLGDRARLIISVRGIVTSPIQIEVEDDFVIGRAAPETSEIPDLDLNPYDAVAKGISRRHVVIMKRGDTLHVMDLESTNGTYLNGVWLYPNQPRVLRDGDELMLGSLILRVEFILPEHPLD